MDLMTSSPGSAVTPAEPAHAWTQWVFGWHAVFWVLSGSAALWILVGPDVPGGQRLWGVAAVGALMAAYALLVQERTWHTDWRTHLYLLVAMPVVGYACSISSTLTLLLFLVYPQSWMLTSTVWLGVLATVGLTVATLIGFMARYGFTVDVLLQLAPQLVPGLFFSVIMGLWIWRIIDQSKDRAELIAQLEAARSDLNAAERARGVMAERERMAREIHDTLAQGFTSIVMLAQAASAGLAKQPDRAAERLATIEDVARQNLAEARALVAAFAPVDLDGSTLTDAVRRLTDRFGAETGLVVDLAVTDGVARLGRDSEVVLLRAVQEALTNVRRHAAARRVVVRLVVDDESARVEVGDDGVGFAPGAAAGGFGLAGMRGRVSEVGGELDVASTPGGGTRVTVSVPVEPRAAAGGA